MLYRRYIWTKIYPTIADFLSRLDELWHWRIGDLEIGEIFVILHQYIVLGREMFDEIGFQYKSLDLRLASDDLDITDLRYHLPLGN